MRLKDRRILITGAASGIGRASAEIFAREGAKLALLDIDSANLEKVAKATGGTAIVADVRSEPAVKAAIEKAAKAMGGIDGVVNAAGVASAMPLATTTLEEWHRVIETNLTGTFLVCRDALPWLQKAEQASIVNLASGQALHPTGASACYAASKGGVMAMSKDICNDLAPKIRVNVICPGTTDTPMVAALRTPEHSHVVERLLSTVPFKRLGEAVEIANAILFLTSNEASFVTGVSLAVDGGRTRH